MNSLFKRRDKKYKTSTQVIVELDNNLFKNSYTIDSVPIHTYGSYKKLDDSLNPHITNFYVILAIHEWHDGSIGVRVINIKTWGDEIIHLTDKQEKIIANSLSEKFDNDCKFVILFENEEDCLLTKITNCFGFKPAE